jgi:LPXTG-motif cell wall-anchored protein
LKNPHKTRNNLLLLGVVGLGITAVMLLKKRKIFEYAE